MEEFITHNELNVVYGSKLCKGLITRIRKVKNTQEKSILDFFIVCKRVIGYVIDMNVDDNGLNIATNYTQVRRGGKSVDSDHMLIEMNLNLKLVPTKQTRNIIFNYKSQPGRQLFQELTSSTKDFANCFNSMQSLQTQSEKKKSVLKSYCNKAFSKVRLRTKRLQTSTVDTLI